MSDVIELYEKYKKRKSGSLVLSWAEFDELLQHIEIPNGMPRKTPTLLMSIKVTRWYCIYER